MVNQPRNQTQGQRPRYQPQGQRPARIVRVRKFYVESHRVSIPQVVSKLEAIRGIAMFAIGMLFNFMLFMSVLNPIEIKTGDGKMAENGTAAGNVTFAKMDEIVHSGTATAKLRKIIVVGVGCHKWQFNQTSLLAMLMCSYLIILYGMAVLWTSYRSQKPLRLLSKKKCDLIFGAWLAVKFLLVLCALTILEINAEKLKVLSVKGLSLLFAMFWLHALLWTMVFFVKIAFYTIKLKIRSQSQGTMAGAIPGTLAASVYEISPLRLIVTYRTYEPQTTSTASPPTLNTETADSGFSSNIVCEHECPKQEEVKESKILID